MQHAQHTVVAGVVACVAVHKGTVLPCSELAYLLAVSKTTDLPWYSPGNKLTPQRHGDADRGEAQECGCSGLQLQRVPETAAAQGGWQVKCECEQVEYLLSMVALIKEEVEKLRTIRQYEKEIDWWSNFLACQR